MAEWIFTFGSPQRHPISGGPLSNCFVAIEAADRGEARAEMFRRFGTKWSWQYGSREEAGVAKWSMRELEGAEALGRLVAAN